MFGRTLVLREKEILFLAGDYWSKIIRNLFLLYVAAHVYVHVHVDSRAGVISESGFV